MNEFLKQLRSQQKDKYPGSYRSPMDNKRPYPHPDRRSKGGDRRQPHSKSDLDLILNEFAKLIPELMVVMSRITETNEKIVDALDHKIEIEEERNLIFGSLARSIELLAEKGGSFIDASNSESVKIKKASKEQKNKVLDLIVSLREDKSTYEEIADYLEAQGIPTFSNKGRWHAQTIHRLYQQRKSELDS
ncbi:MAG: recombinase family protein [Desulforegulaceae bacterium]|nr:recombinase family protein [Desulforegulaceae bacterium]